MALSNHRRNSADDEDREDGGARMGFLEHLDELRTRLSAHARQLLQAWPSGCS